MVFIGKYNLPIKTYKCYATYYYLLFLMLFSSEHFLIVTLQAKFFSMPFIHTSKRKNVVSATRL